MTAPRRCTAPRRSTALNRSTVLRRSKAPQRRDRGAAAVEFALVFPLLVLLVVGIAEAGRAYHVQTTLSGAAREGVRTMAVHNSPSAARTAVKAAAPGLALSDGQIAVTPTSCASGGTATVSVTYPFDFITGLVGVDMTLTGRGTMRCNG
jgi:Flp pilus assembly protein TadG